MNISNPRGIVRFALFFIAWAQFPSMLIAQVIVDSVPSDLAVRRQPPKVVNTPFRFEPGVSTAWGSTEAVRWGAVDMAAIRAEDAIRDVTPGVPRRVGVTRNAPGGMITPANAGRWVDLPNGAAAWLLRLEAADAKAIRIHFSRFDLDEGAEVRLRGTLENLDAYHGQGPNHDAAFWAAPTPGDVAYLEYVHPRGKRDVKLEIDVISHFYRDPGFFPPQAQPNTPEDPEGLLACHESVMCHEVDESARDAVGLMFFDGGFTCTGALLNDIDANTFAGYFLTANHCINTQSSANSLTVYWFYQPAICGGVPPSLASRPKSIGAKLLANSSLSDFSFLRLNDDPENGQGFAAWTTAVPASNGETVQGIHHPGGSWKRYSLGATTSAAPICGGLPTSRFVYNDWTLGVIEGGSSGSPLFNSDFEVIGQLYGYCYFTGITPGCTNQASYNNVYGRFSQSYLSFSSYLNAIIPDDAYEDNDSLAQAPGLDEGVHALRLVDYDDYFKVTFDSDAEVTITATFSTTSMDLDLYFLDDMGGVLASSAGASGTETINTSVPAGIYFIRAAKDSGWGGDYTLNISTFLANCPPPIVAAEEAGGFVKNRFISFVPENSGAETAIRVTLVSLQHPDPPNPSSTPPDFSAFEGQVRWVGPPTEYTESTTPADTFVGATLQCDPHYLDWGTVGLVHVFGAEIMPSSEYEVAAISLNCNPINETNYAPALVVRTGIWGDIVEPIQPPSPAPRTQPDLGDIAGLVSKFRGLPGAPIVARTMLQPNVPDPTGQINFSDISNCVDSFRGVAYPYPGPTSCP